MNKKFFAALASATMAFSATGSLAVFAQDFEEENNPVFTPGDITPKPTTVKWNKDNFGDLVGGKVTFSGFTAPAVESDVNTKTLEAVTDITLHADFNGEVKGLEYFTGLTTFTDNGVVKNTSLDFSANTALENLSVTHAADLTSVTLPNPGKNADDEDVYSLETLALQNTKLTSLDLSDQKALDTVDVYYNYDLKNIEMPKGTAAHHVTLSELNLSFNDLESIDLTNYDITGVLALNNNHIGVLDLSKVVAGSYYLHTQKFYVSETAANVNLKEIYPTIKVTKVEKDYNSAYDNETGVLTLNAGQNGYKYDTGTGQKLEVELIAANPMNRLYNPNSGEHFYTADVKEKDALVALGWNDEGYGWVAPASTDTTNKGADVYRLYNPNVGDHHYTMDTNEQKTLVSYGWKDEGTGWYSALNGKTVYREYNPYANGAGSHNYTTDKAENDFLVSVGWTYEGAAWKALQ